MANVFDIFNVRSANEGNANKTATKKEVSHRQSDGNSPKQKHQVGRDADLFENKHGAKLPGNAVVDEEQKSIKMDSSQSFIIPKLRRKEEELLNEVSLDSHEWQQECLPGIQKSYRFPTSRHRFSFYHLQNVHNTDLSRAYLDKRRELKDQGYSDRDVVDSYAFLHVDSETEVLQVCREGLKIGNLSSSCLGDPAMGVQLNRHADVLPAASLSNNKHGKLIIFKVMKGRVKVVFENRSVPFLEPTPNYECHVSKVNPSDQSTTLPQQLFESSQIYLYEYGDLSVVDRPRQAYPVAVVSYVYREEGKMQRQMESLPLSPRTSSPLATSSPGRSFLTSPVVAREGVEEYTTWTGRLTVKGLFACHVEMFSSASCLKPVKLGTILNINKKCSLPVAREKYFRQLGTLRKNGEVCWKGNYINVCELRPQADSRSQFQKIMNYLGKNNSMAVLKPDADAVLLLVPDCSLTYQLGLTKRHQYPVVLHCIFLSKQSCKFKSSRYTMSQRLQAPPASVGTNNACAAKSPPPTFATPLHINVVNNNSPLNPSMFTPPPSVFPPHFSPLWYSSPPQSCPPLYSAPRFFPPSPMFLPSSLPPPSPPMPLQAELQSVCLPLLPVPPPPQAPSSYPNSLATWGSLSSGTKPLSSSQSHIAGEIAPPSSVSPNVISTLSPLSQTIVTSRESGATSRFETGPEFKSLHLSPPPPLPPPPPPPHGSGPRHTFQRSLSTPDLQEPPRPMRTPSFPISFEEGFTYKAPSHSLIKSTQLKKLFKYQQGVRAVAIKSKTSSKRHQSCEQDSTVTSTCTEEEVNAGTEYEESQDRNTETIERRRRASCSSLSNTDLSDSEIDAVVRNFIPPQTTRKTSKDDESLATNVALSAQDMRTLLDSKLKKTKSGKDLQQNSLESVGMKNLLDHNLPKSVRQDQSSMSEESCKTNIEEDAVAVSSTIDKVSELSTADDMKQFLNSRFLKKQKTASPRKNLKNKYEATGNRKSKRELKPLLKRLDSSTLKAWLGNKRNKISPTIITVFPTFRGDSHDYHQDSDETVDCRDSARASCVSASSPSSCTAPSSTAHSPAAGSSISTSYTDFTLQSPPGFLSLSQQNNQLSTQALDIATLLSPPRQVKVAQSATKVVIVNTYQHAVQVPEPGKVQTIRYMLHGHSSNKSRCSLSESVMSVLHEEEEEEDIRYVRAADSSEHPEEEEDSSSQDLLDTPEMRLSSDPDQESDPVLQEKLDREAEAHSSEPRRAETSTETSYEMINLDDDDWIIKDVLEESPELKTRSAPRSRSRSGSRSRSRSRSRHSNDSSRSKPCDKLNESKSNDSEVVRKPKKGEAVSTRRPKSPIKRSNSDDEPKKKRCKEHERTDQSTKHHSKHCRNSSKEKSKPDDSRLKSDNRQSKIKTTSQKHPKSDSTEKQLKDMSDLADNLSKTKEKDRGKHRSKHHSKVKDVSKMSKKSSRDKKQRTSWIDDNSSRSSKKRHEKVDQKLSEMSKIADKITEPHDSDGRSTKSRSEKIVHQKQFEIQCSDKLKATMLPGISSRFDVDELVRKDLRSMLSCKSSSSSAAVGRASSDRVGHLQGESNSKSHSPLAVLDSQVRHDRVSYFTQPKQQKADGSAKLHAQMTQSQTENENLNSTPRAVSVKPKEKENIREEKSNEIKVNKDPRLQPRSQNTDTKQTQAASPCKINGKNELQGARSGQAVRNLTTASIAEDRHSRQFHPYGKHNKRKPTASFNIGIRNLDLLLENLTASSLKKKRLRERHKFGLQNSFQQCSRFRNYRFSRNPVLESPPQESEETRRAENVFTSDDIPEFEARKKQADLLDEFFIGGVNQQADLIKTYELEKATYEEEKENADQAPFYLHPTEAKAKSVVLQEQLTSNIGHIPVPARRWEGRGESDKENSAKGLDIRIVTIDPCSDDAVDQDRNNSAQEISMTPPNNDVQKETESRKADLVESITSYPDISSELPNIHTESELSVPGSCSDHHEGATSSLIPVDPQLDSICVSSTHHQLNKNLRPISLHSSETPEQLCEHGPVQTAQEKLLSMSLVKTYDSDQASVDNSGSNQTSVDNSGSDQALACNSESVHASMSNETLSLPTAVVEQHLMQETSQTDSSEILFNNSSQSTELANETSPVAPLSNSDCLEAMPMDIDDSQSESEAEIISFKNRIGLKGDESWLSSDAEVETSTNWVKNRGLKRSKSVPEDLKPHESTKSFSVFKDMWKSTTGAELTVPEVDPEEVCSVETSAGQSETLAHEGRDLQTDQLVEVIKHPEGRVKRKTEAAEMLQELNSLLVTSEPKPKTTMEITHPSRSDDVMIEKKMSTFFGKFDSSLASGEETAEEILTRTSESAVHEVSTEATSARSDFSTKLTTFEKHLTEDELLEQTAKTAPTTRDPRKLQRSVSMNELENRSAAEKKKKRPHRSTGPHPDRFKKWEHVVFPITFDPWRDAKYDRNPQLGGYHVLELHDSPSCDPRRNRTILQHRDREQDLREKHGRSLKPSSKPRKPDKAPEKDPYAVGTSNPMLARDPFAPTLAEQITSRALARRIQLGLTSSLKTDAQKESDSQDNSASIPSHTLQEHSSALKLKHRGSTTLEGLKSADVRQRTNKGTYLREDKSVSIAHDTSFNTKPSVSNNQAVQMKDSDTLGVNRASSEKHSCELATPNPPSESPGQIKRKQSFCAPLPSSKVQKLDLDQLTSPAVSSSSASMVISSSSSFAVGDDNVSFESEQLQLVTDREDLEIPGTPLLDEPSCPSGRETSSRSDLISNSVEWSNSDRNVFNFRKHEYSLGANTETSRDLRTENSYVNGRTSDNVPQNNLDSAVRLESGVVRPSVDRETVQLSYHKEILRDCDGRRQSEMSVSSEIGESDKTAILELYKEDSSHAKLLPVFTKCDKTIHEADSNTHDALDDTMPCRDPKQLSNADPEFSVKADKIDRELKAFYAEIAPKLDDVMSQVVVVDDDTDSDRGAGKDNVQTTLKPKQESTESGKECGRQIGQKIPSILDRKDGNRTSKFTPLKAPSVPGHSGSTKMNTGSAVLGASPYSYSPYSGQRHNIYINPHMMHIWSPHNALYSHPPHMHSLMNYSVPSFYHSPTWQWNTSSSYGYNFSSFYSPSNSPLVFTPPSRDYSPIPSDLAPSPQSYSPVPSDLGPSPQNYSPIPSDLGPSPQSYSPIPSELGPSPQSCSSSPVTLDQIAVVEQSRISGILEEKVNSISCEASSADPDGPISNTNWNPDAPKRTVNRAKPTDHVKASNTCTSPVHVSTGVSETNEDDKLVTSSVEISTPMSTFKDMVDAHVESCGNKLENFSQKNRDSASSSTVEQGIGLSDTCYTICDKVSVSDNLQAAFTDQEKEVLAKLKNVEEAVVTSRSLNEGGVINMDDKFILDCEPELLDEMLTSMYALNNAGMTWLLLIHSSVVLQMASRNRAICGNQEIRKKLGIISAYRRKGVVRLAPSCECDRYMRSLYSLGLCVAGFRQRDYPLLRLSFVLSDTRCTEKVPDGTRHVIFITPRDFLTQYLSSR